MAVSQVAALRHVTCVCGACHACHAEALARQISPADVAAELEVVKHALHWHATHGGYPVACDETFDLAVKAALEAR